MKTLVGWVLVNREDSEPEFYKTWNQPPKIYTTENKANSVIKVQIKEFSRNYKDNVARITYYECFKAEPIYLED